MLLLVTRRNAHVFSDSLSVCMPRAQLVGATADEARASEKRVVSGVGAGGRETVFHTYTALGTASCAAWLDFVV